MKKVLAVSALCALATTGAYAWGQPPKKFELINNSICRGCPLPLIVTTITLTNPGGGSFTADVVPDVGPNGHEGYFTAAQESPCEKYVAVHNRNMGPISPAANNKFNVCTQSKITISVSGAGQYVFTYS